MRWDDRLADLFEDLEQQAQGLALGERDAEVAEQRPAEYAQVDLAARLVASAGARVRLKLAGAGRLDGVLRRVGDGWCLVDDGVQDWVVRVRAVSAWRGLADRGVAVAARPLTYRLGMGSALRGVADLRLDVVVHLVDGTLLSGAIGRVGADFVEVRVEAESGGYVESVPFGALSAVRST
jgi:hypothetical protein